MKRKNLYTLLVAGVLLIITVLLVMQNKRSTFNNGDDDFSVADTASIKKIFLADKLDHEVLLEKNENGEWTVNNKYDVRDDAMEVLLSTIKNLSVDRPVSNKAYNSVIKRLSARSVKVEIYQEVYRIDLFNKIRLFPHVTNTKTYYVGGQTQSNMGTYMLLEGGDNPYITGLPGFRGFVSTRYSAREIDWRSHNVFHEKINEIESVNVEFVEEPHKSFEIKNIENRTFKLKNTYENKNVSQFDTLKVIEYLTAFREINYEALLNDMDSVRKDSIISSKPFYVITMKKTDGTTNKVNIFHRGVDGGDATMVDGKLTYDPDRLYAEINNGEDFVLIQFLSFDNVFRSLQYLTGEEVIEQKVSPFSRVM